MDLYIDLYIDLGLDLYTGTDHPKIQKRKKKEGLSANRTKSPNSFEGQTKQKHPPKPPKKKIKQERLRTKPKKQQNKLRISFEKTKLQGKKFISLKNKIFKEFIFR